MDWTPASITRWLFDSERGPAGRLIPRWLFLRALGLIYFSAFFSLVFQIRGLIGPNGILPAKDYLQAVAEQVGFWRHWYAPSLFWFSSGSHMLMWTCWIGMAAAVLLVLNFWPRGMLVICFVCFLSFVSAAGEFSGYQSDGMLLEAGFLSLFFAPGGFWPAWGMARPPLRASWLLLLFEWFRIYFESGIAKMASHDPEWRDFTAMDEYYQNGPLPTWIGWHVQHFPHWFHAAITFATLALELGLIWTAFLPRRFRIALFFIVTAWQIGIILTANYTFLNYLVLVLAVLLLDDKFLVRIVPRRWRCKFPPSEEGGYRGTAPAEETRPIGADALSILKADASATDTAAAGTLAAQASSARDERNSLRRWLAALRISLTAVMLAWIFYATTVQMIWMIWPGTPLPTLPVVALDPFRIANRYGLFAVMTRGRYEIEFQGSEDGQKWIAYPFRYKPQELNKAPGIYAPYQPRFDWNLWFASLAGWRDNPFVLRAERRLLSNDPDVLTLFAANPFRQRPPRQVRAVIWQYWFTTPEERRANGEWWRREYLGLYAPAIALEADGRISVTQWPTAMEPRE
jgi:lipase maturation factor 1